MMNLKKRTTVIAAAMVVVLFSAVAAYAYWSTSGTGTGTAATGTSSAVNAVQTSVIADMGPGTAAQTLSGTLLNTDTQPLYVASVTASITNVTKADGAPAGICDSTDYTLANATMNVGTEAVVADTTPWTGATLMFNNKGTNQDACKLATVTIGYVVA
jgi:hypothetical protein